MECSILSDHRRVPPFGVNGGEDGQVGRNWIVRHDNSIDELGGCAHTDVKAGDTIHIQTPTGGGFGKCEHESGNRTEDVKLRNVETEDA